MVTAGRNGQPLQLSATGLGMKTTRFQREAKRLQLGRQVVFEFSDARRIHRQVVRQLLDRLSWLSPAKEERNQKRWFFCSRQQSKVRPCHTCGNNKTLTRGALQRRKKAGRVRKAVHSGKAIDSTIHANVEQQLGKG